MLEPCVGFLEFQSIAKGIEATDALLKKAEVTIAFSYPVSSGKYLTMFHGEVEAVKSSFNTGKEIGGTSVVDSFLLTNLHPDIFATLQASPTYTRLDALGILELKTCATCIEAADIALKTADVKLVTIRLARGIGGKAYFVINGEVGEVESSLMAASQISRKKEALLEKIIIAQATIELLSVFTHD